MSRADVAGTLAGGGTSGKTSKAVPPLPVPTRKPRFFYGWVIVAIGFVAMGITFGVWYSFSVFFVAVLRDFQMGRADTALAFSVFVAVHGLAGPPIGVLIERFRLRLVMPAGGLFLAASLAACSFVTSPWVYYFTFGVLTALGVAVSGLITNTVAINRWFVKKRGLALGVASAGVGAISIAIAVPFNQYLIEMIGWRSAYLVLAGIVLVVIPPLTFLFQRDRPQEMGLLPDGAPPHREPVEPVARAVKLPEAEDKTWAATEWTIRRALRTKRFWMVIIAFCLSPVANQTVFVHQVAYMMDLGHSPYVASAAVAVLGFASIPAKVVWGWLSDRFGREAIYTSGIACVLVSLAMLLAMPGVSGEWLLYAFAVTFGVGYAVNATMYPAIAADLFWGKNFPSIYGVIGVGNTIGAAAGPWIAGYVFDSGGSYNPAFVLSMVCITISAVAMWIAAPRHVRPVRGWRSGA